MTEPCVTCGNSERAPSRRVCRSCANAEHRAKYSPKRHCVECGETVTGQGRHLYCSDACKLIKRTCIGCGKEFMVERKRKGRNFACSLKCRPSSNPAVDRLLVPCGHCGEVMQVLPAQVERRKFCSRRCAGLGRPICGKPSKIADAAIDEFLKGTPLLCELEKRLGRWSVDMAIPLHQIAVELDGEYWHGLPAMVEKDRRKDEWLAQHGWTVVRIVMGKHDTPEGIARRISEELNLCLTSLAA